MNADIIKTILGLASAILLIVVGYFVNGALRERENKKKLTEAKVETGAHMFTDHLGDATKTVYEEHYKNKKDEMGI